MLNPKFGIKGRFAYDDIKNLNGSESLPFKLQHYQFSFEGVLNGKKVFGYSANLLQKSDWLLFGQIFNEEDLDLRKKISISKDKV